MHIMTVYGWVPLHVNASNSNQLEGVFVDMSIEEARKITGERADLYVETAAKHLSDMPKSLKPSWEDVMYTLNKPLTGAFGERL